jgi:hypothetical protein
MRAIYLPLEPEMYESLRRLSDDQKRDLRHTAATLLKDALIQAGHLKERADGEPSDSNP